MFSALVATLLTALAGAPAHAALVAGDAVGVTYLYPNLGTVYTATQQANGPASSFSNFAGIFDIALGHDTIRLTLTRNAGVNDVAFDGVRLVDVNNTLGFQNFALDAATNYAGFGTSRVSYAPGTIFLNVANLPGIMGQSIVLTSAVPEPESLALALAGLLVISASAWKQR